LKQHCPLQLNMSRVRDGQLASDERYGTAGCFILQGPSGRKLMIISSGPDSEYGWEHVSVSTERHIPNWEEMCFVKNLFWDEEECVMQLHPAKSRYVNCHPRCLHLWKPLNGEIPLPPDLLVGPKGKT